MTDRDPDGQDDAVQQAISALADGAPLRVWSLLVTLFGDLTREGHPQLSGVALSRVTARMGLKPEATRVALHRLRKTGWILSERSGRESLYRLSKSALRETQDASQRIYSPRVSAPERWQIRLAAPGQVPQPSHPEVVALTSRLCLGPVDPDCTGPDLVFDGDLRTLPDWVRQEICDEGLQSAYAALSADFTRLLDGFSAFQDAGTVDLVALRVLVLHRWRRLVLRHPEWLEAILGEDWAGARCRTQVLQLLSLLPVPDHRNSPFLSDKDADPAIRTDRTPAV